MNECERERWEAIRELAAEGYEVGWEYAGQPTEEMKRVALEEMLERYGRRVNDWLMPPEAVVICAEVEADPVFADRLTVTGGQTWAVYGILDEEPPVGAIAFGSRLPRYGEREFDRQAAS